MKIITKIVASLLGSQSQELAIDSSIESVHPENPLLSPQSFVIDYSDIKSWEVKASDGNAFNLDILALINVASADVSGQVKSIMIQSKKVIKSRSQLEESCRFTVTTDQGVIGTCGQFLIADISDLKYSQLTISNLIIPTGDRCIITVVIGINK